MSDPAQVEPPAVAPGPLARDLRSEHSGDYLRLARLWQQKQGLSWFFAAVDSADLRDDLVERLDTAHTDARLRLPGAIDPVYLVALLADASAHAARAHLLLPVGWQPDAPWWQQLNTYRERLAEAFPKPLIWWLPDDCVTLAARNAPDFWNWRETVLSFTHPIHEAPVSLSSVRLDFTGRAEKEVIAQRLKDIEDYLATHARDTGAAAHLLLEAATANERLGQWDASLTLATEAHHRFAELGNDRMAVQAKGKIADILQARGKLDEALAIRQNDVLPVFEQLGDIRSAAVTKGKIADILQARGKLDDALAIRQNDQLPVYEQLGDIREAAITKGKIADILQARGQLNEALTLLRDDVLPVFERAGYAREAGIARDRIQALEVAKQQCQSAT